MRIAEHSFYASTCTSTCDKKTVGHSVFANKADNGVTKTSLLLVLDYRRTLLITAELSFCRRLSMSEEVKRQFCGKMTPVILSDCGNKDSLGNKNKCSLS